MTREVSSTLQLTTLRPVTANSQFRSYVSAVNRMVRRLKRNKEKYTGEEIERIQGAGRGVGDAKGVDS